MVKQTKKPGKGFTKNVNKSSNNNNNGIKKKNKKSKGAVKKEMSKAIGTITKAAQLVRNPINIEADEFENIATIHELKECKLLGVNQKTGKPYTQEWSKDGYKAKATQKRNIEHFDPIVADLKKKIGGGDVLIESKDTDLGATATKAKKKRNKKPKVKASYDKTAEVLEAINDAKEAGAKDSDIEDDINKSKEQARLPKPSRPVKCVDVSAWDDLHLPDTIKKALSELGFSKPTKIQELSLVPAIKDRLDILGAAETGSGKTLAFGLPIIANICRDRLKMQEKNEKQLQIVRLREKTEQTKRKRCELDSEGDSDDDDEEQGEDVDDDDEYVETDDSDVEEYLYNGPDGIMKVEYSDLDKPKRKKKSKNKKIEIKSDDNDELEEDSNEEDEILNEDDSENELDLKQEMSDDEEMDELSDNVELEEESDGDLGSDGDEDIQGSDDDLGLDEDDLGSDEDDLDSDKDDDLDSDKDDDLDSDKDDDLDSDKDDDLDSDKDDDLDSDEDDDLGSDDEQDFEDDKEEPTHGCVRVINNVEFSFDKKEKFVDDGVKPMLRALILTPTRELAIQIHSHLTRVCSHTGIKSGVVVGGMDARKQKRVLMRTRPEILVATPGRLWELIRDGIEHVSDLRGVRYLAIDEADRMIDKKNFLEVHKIVHMMNNGTEISKKVANSRRQTFVFSATLTMVHKLPERLSVTKRSQRKDPTSDDKLHTLAKMVGMKTSAKIIDVTRKHATAENLTECRINCDIDEKDQYLYYFLQRHPGRTMVFCNSVEAVRRLRSVFQLLQCSPKDLHASMYQKQRLRNLQQFTSQPNGLLITTDVAARGLDITDVRHVIHYQVPFTAESYVHRSGRTARGDQSGLSVVFIEPKELIRFRQIVTTLGRTSVNELPAFPVDENLYDQAYERIKLAIHLEKLLHQQKREDQYKAEKKRVAEDIGLIESEDEIDQEDFKLMSKECQDRYNTKGKALQLKHMRLKLNELVQQPLLGAMFSYRHPTNRAALAATMGINADSVPDELVGINPTRNMFEAEEEYQNNYEKEIYGDVGDKKDKNDPWTILKKQRKDLAKLTKKLLKPEQTAREVAYRNKEKKIELQQKKATKKREKRRKKKMPKTD